MKRLLPLWLALAIVGPCCVSALKLYRNAVCCSPRPCRAHGQPAGHSVRIGASPRRDPTAGAPIGAVFSNVKVWDLTKARASSGLKGKSFCDDDGPFLGLGASYFQALRHAKYDRERLNEQPGSPRLEGLQLRPDPEHGQLGWARDCAGEFHQPRRARDGGLAGLLAAVPRPARPGRPARAARRGDHLRRCPIRDAGPSRPGKRTWTASWRTSPGASIRSCTWKWRTRPGKTAFPARRASPTCASSRSTSPTARSVPVAITSNDDTSDQGIISLYRGSAADLATVHFSRDIRTVEGGWLPVRDPYRAGNLPGVPPVSSNEPIGPGSSVGSESDPIKLCSAAVFAYLANLPAYVYHSRAGVYGYVRCCPPAGGEDRFENSAGINAYQFLRQILPPDLASWARNDGLGTRRAADRLLRQPAQPILAGREPTEPTDASATSAASRGRSSCASRWGFSAAE